MADAAISPLTGGPRAASTADPAASRSAETSDAAAKAAGDFETFLQLLTTQMRNQDPLKPVESTEFVAQLASFSAVEQQIGSNTRLDSILEALGGDGAGLTEWIGKEVQAAVSAPFDGDPVSMEVDPAADAERALLVVKDAGGTEVARLPVDPSASTLTWAGETPAGYAPEGAYSFSVEYFSENELLATSPGRVYSEVTELRLGGETSMLALRSGDEISSDEVTAVRAVSP